MFVDGIKEKYPEELIKDNHIREGNLIACFWKNPEFYDDYNIKVDVDFITKDGQFYYQIGYEMYKLGYKSFDETTVYTYLEDKPTLKKGFEKRGGYKSIQELMNLINVENVESYYDELVKYSAIRELYNKGFNVLKDLDKFKKMKSEQLYDYYDYYLNDIFLNKQITSIKIEDLIIDDKFLERCNSGEEMGISYSSACPLLSYLTAGIHKGSLYIFGGYSGTGKTTFSIHSFVLPILEQGEKFCIISNEQVLNEFKHMFLATVLSTKIKYYNLTRKKLKIGGFTNEDWEAIRKAQKYINENYKGRIKFVKLFDYDIATAKKIIKKLSKQGFSYFLYDTFKASDMSQRQVWGNLVEDSKQLFQVASKEDVAIIITMQLALHTLGKRYLDASCLSTAKGVKEVASELILMRKLWDDEYTGQKYDVKPYNYIKGDDGKYTKTKQYVELKPDKKYMILFLDKTRNDEGDVALLYEFDSKYNIWREIGWCNPHHDR